MSAQNIKNTSWIIKASVRPVFRIPKPSFIITSDLVIVGPVASLRRRTFNGSLGLRIKLRYALRGYNLIFRI
jgi:hypothetical protein